MPTIGIEPVAPAERQPMQSVAPAGEKAGDAVPGGPAAQAHTVEIVVHKIPPRLLKLVQLMPPEGEIDPEACQKVFLTSLVRFFRT